MRLHLPLKLLAALVTSFTGMTLGTATFTGVAGIMMTVAMTQSANATTLTVDVDQTVEDLTDVTAITGVGTTLTVTGDSVLFSGDIGESVTIDYTGTGIFTLGGSSTISVTPTTSYDATLQISSGQLNLRTNEVEWHQKLVFKDGARLHIRDGARIDYSQYYDARGFTGSGFVFDNEVTFENNNSITAQWGKNLTFEGKIVAEKGFTFGADGAEHAYINLANAENEIGGTITLARANGYMGFSSLGAIGSAKVNITDAAAKLVYMGTAGEEVEVLNNELKGTAEGASFVLNSGWLHLANSSVNTHVVAQDATLSLEGSGLNVNLNKGVFDASVAEKTAGISSLTGTGTISASQGTIQGTSDITLDSGFTILANGAGKITGDFIVDGAMVIYDSLENIVLDGLTMTSGAIKLSDEVVAGLNVGDSVDLGADYSTGDFYVDGWVESMYSFEGNMLKINSLDIPSVEVVWYTTNTAGTGYNTETQADVQIMEVAGNTSLAYLNERQSTSGDITYHIKNTGTDAVNLFGVYGPELAGIAATATYEGNIKMDVSSGAFNIVGGGVSNEWGGETLRNATLNGNTLVQISGDATVNHVIGGNAKGNNVTLSGNTQVSITGDAIVAGAIVGGNTSAHNAETVVAGNTSVLVTNVQHTTSAGNLDRITSGLIIGGSAAAANSASRTLVEGNTSVLIDLSNAMLSDVEDQRNFVKRIIGGSYSCTDNTWDSHGGSQKITGSSSVVIHGKEEVVFTGSVIGGSLLTEGVTCVVDTAKDTSVVIDGGSTFADIISGGSWSDLDFGENDPSDNLTTAGNTSVTLNGGIYQANIYGAGNMGTVSGTSTVTLNSAATFGSDDNGITVSGTAGATVTGGSYLVLDGDFGAEKLKNVTLTAFNAVTNEKDATVLAMTDMSGDFVKNGAGELSVINATTLTGNVNITAGALNLTNTGVSIVGNLTLSSGTELTTGGNLTLGSNLTMAVDSGITVGGNLNTGTFTLVLTGLELIDSAGTYELITAAGGVDASTFAWEGYTGAEGLTYTLEQDATGLSLVVASAAGSWIWQNGTVWTASSPGSAWGIEGSTETADGQKLIFNKSAFEGGLTEATVNISGAVAPESISVNNDEGTTYKFVSDDGTGKITDGTLTKQGGGVLQIDADISEWDAAMELKGGTLGFKNELIAGNELTVSGDATLDMQANVAKNTVLSADLTINVGDDDAETALVEVTHSGIISGEGALTKTGDGTLTLSGANTFTGAVSIDDGTVKVGHRLAFGANANAVNVADGATLDTNDNVDINYTVTIAGTGVDGEGALINSGSCSQITGTSMNLTGLKLSADATIGGSGWITVLGKGHAIVNVDLAGNVLTKKGANTITFHKGQFTAGTIQIEEGTLRLQGEYAAGTAAVDMVVNSGILDISADGARLNTLNGTGGEVSLGADPKGVEVLNSGSYAGNISGDGGNIWQNNADTKQTLTGKNTAKGTWNLVEGATAEIGDGGQWLGTFAGAGDLELNSTQAIELTAGSTLSGSATLMNTGTVKMLGADSLGTAAVSVNDGVLDMNGQAVANDILITAGDLANAGSATAAVTVDAVAGAEGALNTVDLGGLKGSNVASLTLTEYTRVTGVDGTLDMTDKEVSIKLDSGSVAVAEATANAVVDAALTLTAATTTLDLSNAVVLDILAANKAEASGVDLVLSTGTLTIDNYKEVSFSPLLSTLGYAAIGVENGALKISGNADLTYLVNTEAGSDPDTINDYAALDAYKAVGVENTTLTVNLNGAPATAGDGLQVRNLVGSNASLVVNNSGDTIAEVDLINDAATSFEGDISGDKVDFVKTGKESFTVDGNLTGEGSSLLVEEGLVVLNGEANSLEEIGLGGGNVTLGGASTTVQALVSGQDDLGVSVGGTMTINKDSVLTVVDQDETEAVENIVIAGEGSLVVGDGNGVSNFVLGEGSALDGVELNVAANSALDATDGAINHRIAGLNGEGDLGFDGSTVEVTGEGVFRGELHGSATMNFLGQQTLQGAGNKDYALNVNGGQLTLLGATADSTTEYNSVTVNNATLNIGGAEAADTHLSVGDGGLTVTGDSVVNITTDATMVTEIAAPFVTTTGNITLGDDTGTVTVNTINVNLQGVASAESPELAMELFKTAGGTVSMGNVVLNDQVLNDIYSNLGLSINAAGNAIVMTGQASNVNVFESLGTTPNSKAAAGILWDARFVAAAGDSQLRNLYTAVRDAQNAGNMAGAQQAMTAAAGSTVTSLVISQRDALRDQMGWIRNRVAQMGVNPNYTNEDMPYFHMWMQATGSTATLDTDGDESGYDLNTWGGTFGVDVDLSDSFTAGLAFTAGYGDLSASAADTAKGDMDSYYLNMYARYQSKQWSHLLVMTAGWSDASLTRTVNYGAGSYQGEGDSSGFAFGLMYELAYDIALNEDKSAVLQPLFNLSMVSANMKGYNESGTAGNAGLHVGDMDMVTGTVAVGARLTGLIGSNIFGREALGEVRVNIAQDFGDHQGEARVGFLGAPGTSTVYGAEEGRTAIQIGAGLSVPVGYNGVIYVDGNADLRSGSTSLNASIGYRYDF